MSKVTQEAMLILKEAIQELEAPKGSVLSGVQKLSRAAKILGNDKIDIWCKIQLGDTKYTYPLQKFLNALVAQTEKKTKTTDKEVNDTLEELKKISLSKEHYSTEELNIKLSKHGGGYVNIGFVEATYTDLIRKKSGNDGTYYLNSLINHLNYVRKVAHSKATSLYNSIAFSDVPQTGFDILKHAIEDKLLDLNPELAEKLMIAFKSVSTNNPEEWSQALSTCRRFLEGIADQLYPARDETFKGRSVNQQNYINRIWAFMDQAIESETNKDAAKAHVDYIGSYLQRLYKLSNKGVHTELKKIEAVKTVFHTYLLVADLLDYLNAKPNMPKGKPNVHKLSLDEIQCLLNVSKTIAKEIIKLRVEKGKLEVNDLKSINGVGEKTVAKAKDLLSFEAEETVGTVPVLLMKEE